ncbi:MAG: aldolase/citrate lyase family protein [Betaproteobacteria bacterium]
MDKPRRVNQAIELLEQQQPVYFEFVESADAGGYDGGRPLAQTWADYITYDMEHSAFDVQGLMQFMRGLVDGGPTPSGHRTPPVIVTLPIDGIDEHTVRANSWMIKQVLAAGVHGLLLCHAETSQAVRAFVETVRYSFTKASTNLGAGRRGHGGQVHAAQIWGVSVDDYFHRADPWPLNPQGDLLLGIKVENMRALADVEETTAVPGISFAEWGPGDMGMSMGYPNQHDEPYPAEMQAARTRVMAACKRNGLFFLEQVTSENVASRLDEGVMIACGPQARIAAEIGRLHSARKYTR